MVASIKPYADELALGDGRMLIGAEWVAAADGATWSHTHPATGERVASFPVAAAADVDGNTQPNKVSLVTATGLRRLWPE